MDPLQMGYTPEEDQYNRDGNDEATRNFRSRDWCGGVVGR